MANGYDQLGFNGLSFEFEFVFCVKVLSNNGLPIPDVTVRFEDSSDFSNTQEYTTDANGIVEPDLDTEVTWNITNIIVDDDLFIGEGFNNFSIRSWQPPNCLIITAELKVISTVNDGWFAVHNQNTLRIKNGLSPVNLNGIRRTNKEIETRTGEPMEIEFAGIGEEIFNRLYQKVIISNNFYDNVLATVVGLARGNVVLDLINSDTELYDVTVKLVYQAYNDILNIFKEEFNPTIQNYNEPKFIGQLVQRPKQDNNTDFDITALLKAEFGEIQPPIISGLDPKGYFRTSVSYSSEYLLSTFDSDTGSYKLEKTTLPVNVFQPCEVDGELPSLVINPTFQTTIQPWQQDDSGNSTDWSRTFSNEIRTINGTISNILSQPLLQPMTLGNRYIIKIALSNLSSIPNVTPQPEITATVIIKARNTIQQFEEEIASIDLPYFASTKTFELDFVPNASFNEIQLQMTSPGSLQPFIAEFNVQLNCRPYYYFVNAVNQFKNKDYNTLESYTVRDDGSFDAKFMSDIDNGYIWKDLPYNLSIIFPFETATVLANSSQVDLVIETYDKNGTLLKQDFSLIYDSTLKYIEGVYRIPIEPADVANASYIICYIAKEFQSSLVRISEFKKLDIRQCSSDGVYLTWYNEHGGYDYLLFTGQNSTSINLKNKNTIRRDVYVNGSSSFVDGTAIDDTIALEYNERVSLSAGPFTEVQAKEYSNIIKSPKVFLYDKENDTYTTVLVESNSLNISNNRNGLFTLSLDILKPTGNSITQ